MAVAAMIASGIFTFLFRLIFTHWATTSQKKTADMLGNQRESYLAMQVIK